MTTPASISEKQARYIFWMILLAALALRLPGLSYSFYGDEWFSLVRDSNRLITDTEDRFRPLFFSLLYLWKQIGFSGEVGLRLLPMLFGLLQIPLAYSIGSQLRSRDYGLLFASLIAVSPVLIEFSQELRMYSMVAYIALLQVWLLLYLKRSLSWKGWTGFVLVALAGVNTHIFYWLFLAGLSLSLLRIRSTIPLWKSAAAMMIVALLYLPNIVNLIQFTERRGADYAVHLPSALPKLFAAFTVGFNYFALPDLGAARAVGLDMLKYNWLITLPVLLVILLLAWGFLISHRKQSRSGMLWLGHELFTIPVLLAVIASVVTGKNFLHPKYLIFSAPFLLLLSMEAARAYRQSIIRWLIAGLTVLVLGVAYAHYTQPDQYGRKENWIAVERLLKENVNENTAVFKLHYLYHLAYYNPELESTLTHIEAPTSLSPADPGIGKLKSEIEGKSTVYFIHWDTIQNIYDPKNYFVKALDMLLGEHTVFTFNPRLKVFVWKPPPHIELN